MDEGESRPWEERGLRDAVLRGDAGAWRVLHDRCFEPLYGFVYLRAGRRRDRAEDVVEESWMIAVRRIATFDPERGTFSSWLRGIAENVLRNRARRWQRDDAVLRGSPAVDELVAAHGGAETHLETAEHVALALAGLPERYREALRSRYQEDRTVDEIATRSGDTPKAVESLLSRARAAFREAYRRLEGGTP